VAGQNPDWKIPNVGNGDETTATNGISLLVGGKTSWNFGVPLEKRWKKKAGDASAMKASIQMIRERHSYPG